MTGPFWVSKRAAVVTTSRPLNPWSSMTEYWTFFTLLQDIQWGNPMFILVNFLVTETLKIETDQDTSDRKQRV